MPFAMGECHHNYPLISFSFPVISDLWLYGISPEDVI